MTDTKADYDVIIIGGGATGLSAALYSVRAMLKTLVLEQLACGGRQKGLEVVRISGIEKNKQEEGHSN